MMRVTRDNIDLLVANVKGREYLEREMGLRTMLGSSEPVVRVEGARKLAEIARKLAEIAAATGKSTERLSNARRVKYGGVVFQCFEPEPRGRSDRRMPWA